jgi:hypothetical protein
MTSEVVGITLAHFPFLKGKVAYYFDDLVTLIVSCVPTGGFRCEVTVAGHSHTLASLVLKRRL